MKPLSLVACLALLVVGVASAQIFSDVAFTSTSPFIVGNATLPAGKYAIRLTDDTSMLEISNASGSISVLVEVEPIESLMPAKKTAVVFAKYGNKLVLKSVVIQGQANGALSSTEMAARRQMKAFGKPTKVEVPAAVTKNWR